MVIKSWKRESFGSKLFDVINISLMIILMIIFIYPLLNVIAVSLSDYQSIARGKVTFYPQGFTIDSYTFVLNDNFVNAGI